jgi:hypothetical protein
MHSTTDQPYQVMPPLDAATEAALRSSIQKYGVLTPIVVDQNANVVDGHHRLRIANEVGAPFHLTVVVPESDSLPSGWHRDDVVNEFDLARGEVTLVYVDPDATAEDIARTLNLDRRHLDVDQRLEVVASLHSEGHSIRAIAPVVGVSKSQVAKDIKQLSTSGHLPDTETITGRDGKSYPATKPRKQKIDPATIPLTSVEPVTEYVRGFQGMVDEYAAHWRTFLQGMNNYAVEQRAFPDVWMDKAVLGRRAEELQSIIDELTKVKNAIGSEYEVPSLDAA